MTILTNEEIMVINQTAEFDSASGYARKIEAKILEKLNSQEPVCYVYMKYGRPVIISESCKEDGDVFPLYAHPDPQVAELTRQRDELLADVERTYKMLLSEPDTQGALFKAENILNEAIANVKS